MTDLYDDVTTRVRPLSAPVQPPLLELAERAARIAEDFVNTPGITEILTELVFPLTAALALVSGTIAGVMVCQVL